MRSTNLLLPFAVLCGTAFLLIAGTSVFDDDEHGVDACESSSSRSSGAGQLMTSAARAESFLSISRARARLSQAKAKVLHAASLMEANFNDSSAELAATVSQLVGGQAVVSNAKLRDRCAAELLQAKEQLTQLHSDVRGLVSQAARPDNQAELVKVANSCLAERDADVGTLALLRKDLDEMWHLSLTMDFPAVVTGDPDPGLLAVGLTGSGQDDAATKESMATRLEQARALIEDTRAAAADLTSCLSLAQANSSANSTANSTANRTANSTANSTANLLFLCRPAQELLRRCHATSYGQLSSLVLEYERVVNSRTCVVDSGDENKGKVVYTQVPEENFVALATQPQLDMLSQTEQSVQRRIEALAGHCGGAISAGGLRATSSSLVAVRAAIAALRDCQAATSPGWKSRPERRLSQVTSNVQVNLTSATELEAVLDFLRSFDGTLKKSLTLGQVSLYEGDRLLPQGSLQGMDLGDIELLSPTEQTPAELVFERVVVEVPDDGTGPWLQERLRQESAGSLKTVFSPDKWALQMGLRQVSVRRLLLVHDALVLEALQEAISSDAVITSAVRVGDVEIPRGSSILQEGSLLGRKHEGLALLPVPAAIVIVQTEHRKEEVPSEQKDGQVKLTVTSGDHAALTLLRSLINRNDLNMTEAMRFGPVTLQQGDQLMPEGSLQSTLLQLHKLDALRATAASPVTLVFMRQPLQLDSKLMLIQQDPEEVLSSEPKALAHVSFLAADHSQHQARDLLVQQRLISYDRTALEVLKTAVDPSTGRLSEGLQKDDLHILKGSMLMNFATLSNMLSQPGPVTERLKIPATLEFQYHLVQPTRLSIQEEKVNVNLTDHKHAEFVLSALSDLDDAVRENVRFGGIHLQEGDKLQVERPLRLSDGNDGVIEMLQQQLSENDQTKLGPVAGATLPLVLAFARKTVQIVHHQDVLESVFDHRLSSQNGIELLSEEEWTDEPEAAIALETVEKRQQEDFRMVTLRRRVRVLDGGVLSALQEALSSDGIMRLAVRDGDNLEMPRGSRLLPEESMEGRPLQDLQLLLTPATLAFAMHVRVLAGEASPQNRTQSMPAAMFAYTKARSTYFDLTANGALLHLQHDQCPACTGRLSAREDALLQQCVKQGGAGQLCGCSQVLCSNNVSLLGHGVAVVPSAQDSQTQQRMPVTVDRASAKLLLSVLVAPNLTLRKAVLLGDVASGSTGGGSQQQTTLLAPGDELISASSFEVMDPAPAALPTRDVALLEQELLADPEQKQVKFVFMRSVRSMQCPAGKQCARVDRPSVEPGQSRAATAGDIPGADEAPDAMKVSRKYALQVADAQVLKLLHAVLDEKTWRTNMSIAIIRDITSAVAAKGEVAVDVEALQAEVPAGSEVLREGPLASSMTVDDVAKLQLPATISLAQWVLQRPQAASALYFNLAAGGRVEEVQSPCSPCPRRMSNREEELVQSCLIAGAQALVCNCLDIYCTKNVPRASLLAGNAQQLGQQQRPLPALAVSSSPSQMSAGQVGGTVNQQARQSLRSERERVFVTTYITSELMLKLVATSLNRSSWTLGESVRVGNTMLAAGDALLSRGSLQGKSLSAVDLLGPHSDQPARLIFQRELVKLPVPKGETVAFFEEVPASSVKTTNFATGSFLNSQSNTRPFDSQSSPSALVIGAAEERQRRVLVIDDHDPAAGRDLLLAIQQGVSPVNWRLLWSLSAGGLEVQAGMQLLADEDMKGKDLKALTSLRLPARLTFSSRVLTEKKQ